MVNPISSSHVSGAAQSNTPPKPQPTQQSPQSAPSADKVTLKSSGDVDHDGDSQ
jgi:hypothetical protein